MRIQSAGIIILALVAGVLLLRGHQDTFLPYHPIQFTDLLVFSDASGNNLYFDVDETRNRYLFDFVDGKSRAERIRAQADESMGRGAYEKAIDELHQALQTFSYLDGLYERLDFLYMATGNWGLARRALEAANMQNTVVSFSHLEGSAVRALPEVVDITRESGLEGCRHAVLKELDFVSPGVGVADLDGDGYPDVICLRGPRSATTVYRGGPTGFQAVKDTGLEETLVAQGVYVVDLTHDGLPDVLITAIGTTRLYINQGGMRFSRVDLPLPEMWSSAVAAADFTGNGHVDLVVGGYMGPEVWKALGLADRDAREQLPAEGPRVAHLPSPDARLNHLNVSVRYGVPIHLLEGDGMGGFVDITERSGVLMKGTTLNVELIDVNGDGHLDLLVVNDSMASRLFLGDGMGHFRDITFASKFADARAGMGLAVADFFADGHWDFIRTHFQGEMNGVFMHERVEDGVPIYRDVGLASGLGVPSLPYVGWAAFAWDFDADGREDVLVLNGHVGQNPQPVQLFHNQDGRFSSALPLPLSESFRARGGALFDMTGNGYDDLLLVQNDGSARLFQMHPRHDNQWIRVRVRVPDVDALGGVLEVVDTSGLRQKRPVRTGSAYFSTQPRDFFFGLGNARPEAVIWRGRVSSVTCKNVAVAQVVTITASGCKQTAPPHLRLPESRPNPLH